MRTKYYIVALLSFIASLIAGIDFQYYFRADKATIVAENARNFLTLALVAWCFVMFCGIASILIALLYLCGAPIDQYVLPHGVLAVLWCVSFVLMMVGEIEVVKRDSADGCYDHDPIMWKGPVCTSSSDWGMIGSYIATVIAFALTIAFLSTASNIRDTWSNQNPFESPLSIIVGNRVIDSSNPAALREAVEEQKKALSREIEVSIQEDRAEAREIQSLLAVTESRVSRQQQLPDLEAQAARFRFA